MLEEVPAAELQFVGLAADGMTPTEAVVQLAQALQDWCAAQEDCRVLQLSVLPLTPLAAAAGYSATALLAYRRPVLLPSDAAEAVAAAVEEVREAQTSQDDRDLPERH